MKSRELLLSPSRLLGLETPRVPLRSLRTPPTDRAWVAVDLDALAWNTREVRRCVPAATRILAVVKADAYGHGAAAVSRTVLEHGASELGVATVEEGIDLREAGIEAPILLLGCVRGRDSLSAMVRHGITPTVCSIEHAQETVAALESLVRRGELDPGTLPLAVHAKVDTGMARLGSPRAEIESFARYLGDVRETLSVVGLYSHLACADSPSSASRDEQRLLFEDARASFARHDLRPRTVHLGNSAAVLSSTAFHYDLVRIGLAIYGLCPAEHLKRCLDLRAVLEAKSRVTQVRTLAAGDSVGYGATWRATRETRLATVGVGFADGVPRTLSNRLEVLVRGRRVPQVGRITMDQLMIDVSAVESVQPGDEVTLIGRDGKEEITAKDWADLLGTIAWEVVCLFKARVPRVAVRESARELTLARMPALEGRPDAPLTLS